MKQIKDIFPIILLLLSGLASCSTDELPDNNDKEKTPVGSITSLQISVSDFKGKSIHVPVRAAIKLLLPETIK